jgi:hypothetical protein
MLQAIIAIVVLVLSYGLVYTLLKNVLCIGYGPLIHITTIIFLTICLSFLYYLTLVAGQNFTLLLGVLSIACILSAFYFKKQLKAAFTVRNTDRHYARNFIALAATFTFTVYFVLVASKYGGWDAWAMWNLKAKYLFYANDWKNVFSPHLSYSSRDYPLMLPSIIAFISNAIGADTPLVPMFFSYGVSIILPLLVYFALWKERLYLYAILALLIFVFDSSFKLMASAQEADALLSLLLLLTFVLYNTLKKADDNQVYIISFVCVSCAWVKNEGIVFMLLFSGCFIMANYKNRGALKKYFTGAIIPLTIWASFKLCYSPANSVVANNTTVNALTAHLTDVERYAIIIKAWIKMLFSKYLVLVVLTLAGLIKNRPGLVRLPFVVISLLIASYFVVYLVAPGNVNWLLYTSLVRLFLHVYPALVYLLLATLKGNKNKNVHYAIA